MCKKKNFKFVDQGTKLFKFIKNAEEIKKGIDQYKTVNDKNVELLKKSINKIGCDEIVLDDGEIGRAHV